MMRRFGLALLLLTATAWQGAMAAPDGCTPEQKAAMNHNAKDPTRPGVIGGCGTNPFKVEKFNKDQNRLKNQKIMQGPPRLNNGNNL